MDKERGKCRGLHRKTRKGWLGTNPSSLRRGERSQWRRSQRSVLGTQQCPGTGTVSEARPHLLPQKLLLQLPGGPLLPFNLGLCGLWLLFTGWGVVNSLLPWWHLQARIQNDLPTLSDRLETRQRNISLQPVNHAFRNGCMSLSDPCDGNRPNSPNVRQGALAPRWPIQARLPRVQGSPKCAHQTGHSACQESDEGMSTRSRRGVWQRTRCLLASERATRN